MAKYNALLWGFEGADNKAIIQNLQDLGLIDPRVWISCDFEGRPSSHIAREKLRSAKWLDLYATEYDTYTQNCGIDHACYDFVFQQHVYFVSVYSRFDEDSPYYAEYTHFLHQFNLFYTFFYALLNKQEINFCLFSDVPHEGPDIVIYYLAKYFSIPTLILSQSIFEKFFFMLDTDDYGEFPDMNAGGNKYVSLPQSVYTDLGYMANVPEQKAKSFIRSLLRGSLKPRRFFERLMTLQPICNRSQRYIENLFKYAVAPDYTRPYIYFPLHLQPELTTSVLGGKFNDQILALELLSEMIPDSWVIYAKENPKQEASMRPDVFFKRLSLLKNVQLVDSRENTFKLIEGAQFVSTISGTAGWEAIKGGKKVLIFGKAWYQNLPGVFRYNSKLQLVDIMQCQFSHEEFEVAANALFNKMHDGVVSSEFYEFFADYDSQRNIAQVSDALKGIIQWISTNGSSSSKAVRL